MKHNFKKVGIFGILLLIILISPIVYYQLLINKGSEIADKYCLVINPLIINGKNSYLKSLKLLEDSAPTDKYLAELDTYFNINRQFIIQSEDWIKEQQQFIQGPDFKFLTAKPVQMAAYYQLQTRIAEVETSKLLQESVLSTDSARQKEIYDEIVKITLNKIETENQENDLWKAPVPFHLLSKLTKVPRSTCPDENFNIPETPDPFNLRKRYR